MSTDEKKATTNNINEAFAGMTADQIKTELINQLVKKAKSKKNILTYSDMADYLDAFDLDKNVVDEIYESLLSKDIEIASETEPGEYAKGVIPAVEMLRGIGDDAMPDFNGKSVVVIGGGNVAMDVARTAKRLGASEVCIVYRRRRDDMTALPDEIGGAIAEGCQLFQLKAPSEIIVDKNGHVKGLYVQPQIAGISL